MNIYLYIYIFYRETHTWWMAALGRDSSHASSFAFFVQDAIKKKVRKFERVEKRKEKKITTTPTPTYITPS